MALNEREEKTHNFSLIYPLKQRLHTMLYLGDTFCKNGGGLWNFASSPKLKRMLTLSYMAPGWYAPAWLYGWTIINLILGSHVIICLCKITNM